MAATPSVYVRKYASYKGGTKTFGNRYHFDGGSPTTLARWQALADAITTAERLALSNDCHIDEVVCYDAGSDIPVASFSYTLTGAVTPGGAVENSPLEVSALIRYSTTQRTSKNHPIYLFNYIRAALRQTDVSRENLATTQKTALETYATAWLNGFSDGSIAHHRAGPNGAVAQSRIVDVMVTHRDFPR